MKAWKVLSGIAALIGGTAGITLACSASSPSPVYTCTDYSSCTDGQFLLIKDHLGNPVFAVGQTGGPKTFGDCQSDYAPSSIYVPAVTICYRPPAESCKAPELWIDPTSLWTCTPSGTWTRHRL